MKTKYYQTGFAENGERDNVNNSNKQEDTSVAYDTGYTQAYSNTKDSKDYHFVERKKFNQILFDATSNIKSWQENTFFDWIADKGDGNPFAYSTNAIVRYKNKVYVSTKDNNSEVPDSSSYWNEANFTAGGGGGGGLDPELWKEDTFTTWVSGDDKAVYHQNAVVRYGDRLYFNRTGKNDSTKSPTLDGANWTRVDLSGGLVNMDDWNYGTFPDPHVTIFTTYKINSLVRNGQDLWICDADGSYWEHSKHWIKISFLDLFKQGIPSFETDTTYAKNAIVYVNGDYYIYPNGGKSAASPDSPNSGWKKITLGGGGGGGGGGDMDTSTWIKYSYADYQNSQEYVQGALVHYNGDTYVAKSNFTSDAAKKPDNDSNNWHKFDWLASGSGGGDMTTDEWVRYSYSEYKNSQSYISGALVHYGGSTYVAKSDFTSGSTTTPDVDTANWDKVEWTSKGGSGGGLDPKTWKTKSYADYENGLNYKKGALVHYQDSTYAAKRDVLSSKNRTPSSDPNNQYWQLVTWSGGGGGGGGCDTCLDNDDWKSMSYADYSDQSIDYKTGALVHYSGSTYVAKSDFTSSTGETPANKTDKWDKVQWTGKGGGSCDDCLTTEIWQVAGYPTYSSGSDYLKNAIVHFAGKTYVSKKQIQNAKGDPSSSNDWFEFDWSKGGGGGGGSSTCATDPKCVDEAYWRMNTYYVYDEDKVSAYARGAMVRYGNDDTTYVAKRGFLTSSDTAPTGDDSDPNWQKIDWVKIASGGGGGGGNDEWKKQTFATWDSNVKYLAGGIVRYDNATYFNTSGTSQNIDPSVDIGNWKKLDWSKLFVNYMPTGSIITFAGKIAPDGFLLCDGNSFKKTDHPELAKVISHLELNGEPKTPLIKPDAFMKAAGINYIIKT